MMRQLFIATLMLSALFACRLNTERNKPDYFILRGHIADAGMATFRLSELTTSDLILVDHIQSDINGTFSYTGELREAAFFILETGHNNKITLLIEPGEEIFITGGSDNFDEKYEISGSAGSALLIELNSILLCNRKKLDSLKSVYRGSRNKDNYKTIRVELEEAYMLILKKQQGLVKQFIKRNPNSLASIMALHQSFGRKQLLSIQDDFCYFESLARSLSDIYPTNRHVMELNRVVGEHRREMARQQIMKETLAIGNIAPEIALPDPSGEIVSLSSFRGNYVLIDFWATWCTPCRQANRELVDLYEAYNRYGFEVFGISLDRTREQWLQGIAEDNISWTQVSDLRFWKSPVVSMYNVKRIPHTVLINPDGEIIKKGITVNELEDFLSAVFDAYLLSTDN